MNRYRSVVLFALAAVLSYPSLAWAWLRPGYREDIVVKRAELIAVGHLKEGSLVYISHQARNGGGESWEFRGVLIVTTILKGQLTGKETPVTMHYGLLPVTGGYLKTDHLMIDERHFRPDYPKDVIEIFDTAEYRGAITDDIRKDHLWFLRFHNGDDERDDSTDTLGIWDPEDIQLAELQAFFQAFLGTATVDELKTLALGHSAVAIRSQIYLDHLAIERALQEPDLIKRAELLVPFCLYTDAKEAGSTQRDALFEMGSHCGLAGAARLVPIFNNPQHKAMQATIIVEWGNAQYHEAVPILVDLLKQENQFWAHQTRAERDAWADMRPSHQPSLAASESEQRVQLLVSVLQRLGDANTKPVLEETKRLWSDMHIQNVGENIIRRCDDAIAFLDRVPETP